MVLLGGKRKRSGSCLAAFSRIVFLNWPSFVTALHNLRKPIQKCMGRSLAPLSRLVHVETSVH